MKRAILLFLYIISFTTIYVIFFVGCKKSSSDPAPNNNAITNPTDTSKIKTIAEDWNYYFNINITPDTSQRQNYSLTFINYSTTQKIFRYKNANQYLFLSLPNTKAEMLKYISDSLGVVNTDVCPGQATAKKYKNGISYVETSVQYGTTNIRSIITNIYRIDDSNYAIEGKVNNDMFQNSGQLIQNFIGYGKFRVKITVQ